MQNVPFQYVFNVYAISVYWTIICRSIFAHNYKQLHTYFICTTISPNVVDFDCEKMGSPNFSGVNHLVQSRLPGEWSMMVR